MACIELYATGQNYHTEKLGFGYMWLWKKIPDTTTEGEPSFRNVSLLRMLTSGLESFGHKSTPSDWLWIEAYCPKF